jgi:hypothetical protein
MKITSKSFLFISFLIVGLNGCNKDEKTVSPPVPGNEFLTSVRVTATNTTDPTDVQVAIITDTTIISNPPESINHDTLNLKANSVYSVTVEFLDETKNPPGQVTDDIYTRRNYHLICFDVSSGLNLTVARTDLDTNNPPLQVGLQDKITSGAVSKGTLNVQLRHQPNAKNGDCAPGSTDADVTYTVNIY